MGMMSLLWPFSMIFGGAMLVVGLLVLIFWIWMLIDCAKRNFRNNTEKIVWIIIIALTGWLGSLVYFIAVRSLNHQGLAKK